MALKDILLQLTSYPRRTPKNVITAAAELATLFEARLSGAVCRIEMPDPSNFMARKLTDITQVIAVENDKSWAAADALIEEFRATATESGQTADTILLPCRATLQSTELIRHARLHDLTIMPMSADAATQFTAQDLIFGSGRPVLLMPENVRPLPSLEIVVVAWDGSRAASRAVADALPFLRRSRIVRLVTVTGEKPLGPGSTIDALRDHLSLHGISAIPDTEAADGSGAGEALVRYCGQHGADLLVMGAYGHSRVRDFIAGGATKSLLATTPLPVLLSH
ncbi:universal stress protein [Sphingomonas sp. KC8]|uniref:universal stress protein n=1 Tax=Sphingomonas sp. KC8 TaxID=1030157 RepID=UPI0002489C7D|nr:universal stress protein [Sphingomonas sp. KC8]ARS29414.1 universal stress protein UspA [Sphingomonas sp. KC8]